MGAATFTDIFTHFAILTDPRVERTRLHALPEMMAIALCAAICGAEGWADVERFGKAKQAWFARFLKLEHGIPSHDTFGRVFARLDTAEFFACLQSWLEALRVSFREQGIAIDGKTLRRSFDTAVGKSAVHLVSAWASDLRLSLGQVAVDDKSNEITAVPRLLELLELAGAVVTLDAMHCQKETAAAIRARGADYVLTVKRNQPTLSERLNDWFIDHGNRDYRDVRRHVTVQRSHGRNERREYFVAAPPTDLVDSGEWADLGAVGMVFRQRESHGVLQEETTFFISSLPPKVKRLAKLVRGHWAIENSLHWSLDVTFTEDQSRLRQGAGPEVAAVFRRLALSVLQQDTSLKSSLRGKRLQAGWNNDVLQAILLASAGK